MDNDKWVSFARARLDELELLAEGGAYKGHKNWRTQFDAKGDNEVVDDRNRVVLESDCFHPDRAPFIAANDPAYVLADIAAKRKIIDECQQMIDQLEPGYWFAGMTARMLCEPWALHEEYPGERND